MGKQKHGMYNSPEYMSWCAMKKRCTNPKHKAYARYGGRGINIAVEWLEFVQFYLDMGKRPIGTSLSRIDNNLGYSKDNCEWASDKVQNRNKCNNHYVQGKSIAEWAETLGVNVSTLRERAKRWGDVPEVINTPVQTRRT